MVPHLHVSSAIPISYQSFSCNTPVVEGLNYHSLSCSALLLSLSHLQHPPVVTRGQDSGGAEGQAVDGRAACRQASTQADIHAGRHPRRQRNEQAGIQGLWHSKYRDTEKHTSVCACIARTHARTACVARTHARTACVARTQTHTPKRKPTHPPDFKAPARQPPMVVEVHEILKEVKALCWLADAWAAPH